MLRKRSAETTPAWRAALIQYIAAHPDRPLKARALAREIGVPNDAYAEYRALVRDMLEEGALVLGSGRTLRLPETADTFRGVFRANRRGFGFIECPGRPDVFVPRHATGNALDGDTVEARQLRGRRRDDAPRAQIVRVVERAPTNWVGVLERLGPHWIVRPHGKAPAPVVHIADPTAKGARPGELVVVEPIDTRLNARSVRGVIVERLGPPTKTRVKTTAVARRFGLPTEFSEEVRTAAHACVAAFDPKDRRGREDLTNLLTITIDPPDARDFDDAISIAPREGGLVELGVHIADVSAFVRPGSPLDEEARRRGNSTYFPGHVVPMLPEVLSNGLCSLQPGEPRLTKSAFIVYDRQANVVDTRLANSVIRSRARLTYDEVTSFLEGKGTKPPTPVAKLLRAANDLAKRIQARRRRAGMISLSLPEPEIRLDQRGEVCDAGPADTSFSHTIIEMFMIEANEAVCRRLAELDIPHLRRVHPDPEPEALARLGPMLAAVGLRAPRSLTQKAIQELVDSVSGKPEEPAVNMMLLRSLAQAYYSPEMLGHFALASRHYCHFTSPIRRYPDLVIHRTLDKLFAAERRRRDVARQEFPSEAELMTIGRLTSATERRSQQAEREAVQWLLVDLLADKVGECFDAVITGVASIGAFVQLRPVMAEGLIHVEDFGRDVWEFNEKSARFVGRHSRRVVGFGQPCRVQLVSVDATRQELRLIPEDAKCFGQPLARPGRGKREASKPKARAAAAARATGKSRRRNAGRGKRARRGR